MLTKQAIGMEVIFWACPLPNLHPPVVAVGLCATPLSLLCLSGTGLPAMATIPHAIYN